VHELAEEFCGGVLREEHAESFASSENRREGDGAAPGCGQVAVGIGVAGKEENDGCPENYRQPGFDEVF